jgi:hypothetical protein
VALKWVTFPFLLEELMHSMVLLVRSALPALVVEACIMVLLVRSALPALVVEECIMVERRASALPV